MRSIEEIQVTLKRYKYEELQAEDLMNKALRENSEFAYNAHKDDLNKAKHYIEILEYVLGERE